MQLLATIHPPETTEAIFECLDLRCSAPPTARAYPDPEEVAGWPVDLDANP